MCGIAGALAPRQAPELLAPLGRALDRLRHRGPDDEGVATIRRRADGSGPWAALGNRRLAIVDLSPGGHQPMSTPDGRWTLVLNGEIYNHVELRDELTGLGHAFRSRSDTEVLLAALAAWGPAALGRLVGMFALAAVDREAGTAWLARDPLGIKPLYYGWSDDALVFASEHAALLEFPGLGRRVDPAHVWAFLTLGSTDYGEGTLFADIRQVPAAHCLEVPLDRPRTARLSRYWQLDLTRELRCSFPEAAARVREAFLESLRLHLRSDVPLGFALSGGIDSSAVLLGARRLLGPDAELHAFTFIPDEPGLDESAYVSMAGEAARAVMHPLRLTADDLRRDVGTLATLQGEPFASPVIYAQYRVFGLARDAGMRVLLGGQGADELLAGYDRYFVARAASLLRQGRWVAAAQLLRRAVTRPADGRVAAARGAIRHALPPRLQDMMLRRWRRARAPMAWLHRDWFAAHGVTAPPEWSTAGPRVMRELLAHNLLDSQVQALMRYEDRNAMALSIENRVPFLTPAFVELIFALPEQYILSADGTRKAVFREAMRGIVPDAILDRRDKIGFSVPLRAWFEALRPWLVERLALAAELPCLDRRQVHMRRAALRAGAAAGNPYLLWRWVSLAVWAERYGVSFA